MEWHPTNPNILAVGSKSGDIMLWDTVNVDNDKFVQGVRFYIRMYFFS
jgi:DNA damage-binding protein 2